MTDNIKREVRKMKRDASATSGDSGVCPFCAQPFRSTMHSQKSYEKDAERCAGAREKLLDKLDEMARNREAAVVRQREQEREREEALVTLKEAMPARTLGGELRQEGKLL